MMQSLEFARVVRRPSTATGPADTGSFKDLHFRFAKYENVNYVLCTILSCQNGVGRGINKWEMRKRVVGGMPEY